MVIDISSENKLSPRKASRGIFFRFRHYLFSFFNFKLDEQSPRKTLSKFFFGLVKRWRFMVHDWSHYKEKQLTY